MIGAELGFEIELHHRYLPRSGWTPRGPEIPSCTHKRGKTIFSTRPGFLWIMMDIDSSKATEDEVEPLGFGYYIALFVDLLGQSAQLDKFPNPLAINEFEDEKTLDHMKDTILNLRTVCEMYITAFNSSNNVEPPPEFRGGADVTSQYFSDSLLFYTRLFDSSGRVNIRRISSIFSAAATTQITSLARGIPLRGGIDIGIAANFDPIGLYGPLVKSTHHLESKRARYPRIVIGDTCQYFVNTWAESPESSEYWKMLKRLGNTLRDDMFFKDSDGILMLDYLGRYMADIGKRATNAGAGKMVGQAYHFANEQKIKFGKDRGQSGNSGKEAEKLFLRYSTLVDYIKHRKDTFWRK